MANDTSKICKRVCLISWNTKRMNKAVKVGKVMTQLLKLEGLLLLLVRIYCLSQQTLSKMRPNIGHVTKPSNSASLYLCFQLGR